MSILPKALDYAQKSLLIAESLNDLKSLPACYNTLGDIYSGLSDFNLGRLYHEKAYNISKQIDNKRGMAMALLKIGSDFFVYRFISCVPSDKATTYISGSMLNCFLYFSIIFPVTGLT